MNFNFNNHRNFHMGNPLMRHFTTIGFVPSKPETQFGFNGPESLLNGAQNRFFSSYAGNKSFSNPNFVNKQNPNILTPSVAGLINLDTPKRSHTTETRPNFCVQQPRREKSPSKSDDKTPDCNSSQPEMITKLSIVNNNNNNTSLIDDDMLEISAKSCKKNVRARNRKKRRAKRAKDPVELKSKMLVKCSSPKKFKRDLDRGRVSRRCKPWHKFDKDCMDLDEVENGNDDNNCYESSPIDIKLPEHLTISFSPEILNCLSEIASSPDVCSFSPQSPVIHRIRMPSECDSEDSFIVFCDDVSCASDASVSGDLSDSDSTDSYVSDFDCGDFIEKTDLNREETRKKVSFKSEQELCKVHPMVKWDFAYREARKGPWEEMARDRARFRMRIQDTEFKLKKIFGKKHREKIYKDRFENEAI